MSKKTLFRELFINFLIIVIAAVVLTAMYATISFRNFYFQEIATDLEQRARMVEPQVRAIFASAGRREDALMRQMEALCADLGTRGGFRLTVILPSGTVVGDTAEKAEIMEDHSGRPEVVQALENGMGMDIRYSRTLQRSMMYVALPLRGDGDNVLAVVRVSLSASDLDRALGTLWRILFFGGLVFCALAVLLIYFRSRKISLPLLRLARAAEGISRGEFDQRIELKASFEITRLAGVMNRMSSQLKERIDTITRQRAQAQAMLSGMTEGVIAVDKQKNILSMNRAALSLFHVEKELVIGERIEEYVPVSELLQMIEQALAGNEPVERELSLYNGGERLLHVLAVTLADGGREIFGVLLVLRDITRIRRLETVRKEFAMNVSHELRTPLTSIKGFTETILEKSLHNPEEIKRFLAIIQHQTDRVIAIVDDLMSLARLEKDTERGSIELSPLEVASVCDKAAQACRPAAEAKKIELRLTCEQGLQVRGNALLLEQALVNLVDNAVKYSDEQSGIELMAFRREGEIVISVTDRGCGIAAEHLPRIFERFYRVDKARSSELGGTGLGLAIVKHIAQAHGGRAEVASRIGEGSTFSLVLPVPA
jgi:two-component system phosphate regulon sensor histidine kinase PhoR